MALRLYMDAVAFADCCEERWHQDTADFQARRAFVSTGASGGIELVLGARQEDAMASVFAEVAHRYGWLVLDNPLEPSDFAAMGRAVDDWCASDRTFSETLAEFGTPTIQLGSNNRLYPKTLGYGAESGPLLFLHFWNGAEPGAADVSQSDHPEPLLLAARRPGGDTFLDEFTFTPKGKRRRQQLGVG